MYTNGSMLHVLMGNLLLSLYKMPGTPTMSAPADLPHCFSLPLPSTPPRHCITRFFPGLFHHSPAEECVNSPPPLFWSLAMFLCMSLGFIHTLSTYGTRPRQGGNQRALGWILERQPALQ